MSRKNRPLLSLRGEVNVPTTEPIAQPLAEPNAPIPEKIMEVSVDKNPNPAVTQAEVSAEPTGPTAKEMAAAEEQNLARVKAIIERQQAEAEARAVEPISILGLAAQGMDALHDAIRAHNAQSAVKEYIPPPRTERQMTQLEAELEAGRRAQQKAQAQQDARPVPVRDLSEGVTNPVHRPNDMVPDPMTGKLGLISG
jgi:hypothetical protein